MLSRIITRNIGLFARATRNFAKTSGRFNLTRNYSSLPQRPVSFVKRLEGNGMAIARFSNNRFKVDLRNSVYKIPKANMHSGRSYGSGAKPKWNYFDEVLKLDKIRELTDYLIHNSAEKGDKSSENELRYDCDDIIKYLITYGLKVSDLYVVHEVISPNLVRALHYLLVYKGYQINAAISEIQGLDRYQLMFIPKGLSKNDLLGFKKHEINFLVDLKRFGLTTDMLRSYKGRANDLFFALINDRRGSISSSQDGTDEIYDSIALEEFALFLFRAKSSAEELELINDPSNRIYKPIVEKLLKFKAEHPKENDFWPNFGIDAIYAIEEDGQIELYTPFNAFKSFLNEQSITADRIAKIKEYRKYWHSDKLYYAIASYMKKNSCGSDNALEVQEHNNMIFDKAIELVTFENYYYILSGLEVSEANELSRILSDDLEDFLKDHSKYGTQPEILRGFLKVFQESDVKERFLRYRSEDKGIFYEYFKAAFYMLRECEMTPVEIADHLIALDEDAMKQIHTERLSREQITSHSVQRNGLV